MFISNLRYRCHALHWEIFCSALSSMVLAFFQWLCDKLFAIKLASIQTSWYYDEPLLPMGHDSVTTALSWSPSYLNELLELSDLVDPLPLTLGWWRSPNELPMGYTFGRNRLYQCVLCTHMAHRLVLDNTLSNTSQRTIEMANIQANVCKWNG